MGAAKSRKQARDDVSENGCCHDLTATNELSRVYWPGLPDQVSPNASLPRSAQPALTQWPSATALLSREVTPELTAPRLSTHPHHFADFSKAQGDDVAVVELALRRPARDSHISFCALTNSR